MRTQQKHHNVSRMKLEWRHFHMKKKPIYYRTPSEKGLVQLNTQMYFDLTSLMGRMDNLEDLDGPFTKEEIDLVIKEFQF
jgi:hypothetical protein